MMAGTPPDTDGWAEYRLFVLSELKRHSSLLEKLAARTSENKISIAKWAALGAGIPAVITLITTLLLK